MIPPIHVVTPVWGKAYTKCFVEIALPSLLAPGNLPALDRSRGNLFHIFTVEADRATIEGSAAYQQISAIMDVRIDIIPEEAFASDNRYESQSYGYRKGIETADERCAAIVFFNPDFIVADGGFRSMVRLLEQGKRGIQVLNIRLIKERVDELVEEYRSDGGAKIVISPRDLVSIAMRSMHPITIKHVYDAPIPEMMPQCLYFTVGEEGLVGRCFHLHPMLVYPRVQKVDFLRTVDEDYLRVACPNVDDEYVVVDSDEFYACELSGMERDIAGVPRNLDDYHLGRWARWSVQHHHLEHFTRRVILHSGETDSAAWRDACARSDEVVQGVLRAVLRLWKTGEN